MCKNFFYRFLHFEIFNLNQLLINKIKQIEPTERIALKLDFYTISSIFVNNIFLFFKILKIVRNCHKLSKNVMVVKKQYEFIYIYIYIYIFVSILSTYLIINTIDKKNYKSNIIFLNYQYK